MHRRQLTMRNTYRYLSALLFLSTAVLMAQSISPATVTLKASEVQLFSVQNAKTRYLWSISPSLGSIATNGRYTAPSSITATTTVTITASAPSAVLTATVTLMPTVTISVAPSWISMTNGQSAAFSASISGASNTAVTWSNPAVGTLTAGGVYTVPANLSTQQTITITAQSVADPTKTASATIALIPTVSVSLSPASTTLTGGQSTAMNPVVHGTSNTGLNWTLSPQVGTLSNGVYTAPSPIVSAQSVTVTAASQASTGTTASVTLSLVPVSVSVSPATASLNAGQTASFTPNVSGTGNTAVTWSLSPAVGSISNGIYTAPSSVATAQSVTVQATSNADSTKSATAVVSLKPSTVSISVSPTSASLTGGQSTTITASVSGSSNTGVTWSLSPSVGTLSGGVYTAPATILSAQTVTVKATSNADSTKSASASISLVPPAPVVSVSVSPTSASLTGGQSATIAATVTGSSNTAVTWSMSPSVGTLSGGVYTAPATISSAQTVTVKATSVADTTKSASAAISLTPPAPSVSISVSPTSVSLLGGQTATFTPTVSGSSNTAVNWTLSPSVGTIANGVYTAPASVSAQQNVTVAATSAADPTKVATAVVTLLPSVSITISPTTASLSPSQSMQFNASLGGTSNPNVTWSMSPSVGSLSNGLYQAPSTINSQQNVTVTVTSSADATKSASATISLVPTVGAALTPSSTSLTGGQSTQFTASIGGTTTTAVTWSLAPSVGTITNGVYTAPVTITTLQTIVLTVASIADPTQTATANITLNPAATSGLSVSPSTASLNPSGTQQFTANGLGTSPNWTLSPNTGSITSAGFYSAPSSVTTKTTVTVKATNASDSTKWATATVTLNPASSQGPPPTTITLPLEVIGPDGTTVSASFSIPSGTNLTGLTLSMQIHGLRSQNQASLQLNGGVWQPISEGTVTLLGLANAYGGMGGGFHTLKMTMPVPSGALQTGANTLTFRFNGTDGRVSGFRVLAFNVQDANGDSLIPSSTFVSDDPNAWQPPSTNPTDIAAGKTLWRTAPLTVPTSTGNSAIKAHCMDCHSEDGRDLKYFNYSNNSIRTRSLFHGLTAAQGDQIASFIRSLNVPNPGRPWNPPYQPGPGLDEQPVTNWSAGAGLDAVLDTDAEMFAAMFPNGVNPNYFSASGIENIRETPIAMQLPDWNTWLPIVHPMDAWPDFLTSNLNLRYAGLLASLQTSGSAAYTNDIATFDQWNGDYVSFVVNKTNAPASSWTLPFIEQVYSTPLWTMVKTWELNQEFGLEGLARTVFLNPSAEPRAWRSGIPFLTSPNILHIPRGSTLFENGRLSTWVYAAFIWYHTQLVLDNSEYQQHGASTLDWGYSYAKIADMSQVDSVPQAALFTLWQTKGVQLSNNGYGPDNSSGWIWQVADISRAVTPALRSVWTGLPLATRTAIYQGLVDAWLSEVTKFTPQQFYNGTNGVISASQVPKHFLPDSPRFVDRVWYMISHFKYFGVNQTQINQMAAWAESIWPNGGFAATATASCFPSVADKTVIDCNTDK